MDRVYNNAECTIAANTATRDVEASLVEPALDSPRKRTISEPFPYLISSIAPDDLIYLAPLSHRGWCFQERLLSKCIVHSAELNVICEASVNGVSRYPILPTAMFPNGEICSGILSRRKFTQGSLQLAYQEPGIQTKGTMNQGLSSINGSISYPTSDVAILLTRVIDLLP